MGLFDIFKKKKERINGKEVIVQIDYSEDESPKAELEDAYVVDQSACIACGACIDACPMNTINFNNHSKAEINQNDCIQCGSCETDCPVAAISYKAKKNTKTKTYIVDKEHCVGCTLCAEECFMNAISYDSNSCAQIDQTLCVSCGKCSSFCPTSAIIMTYL